MNAVLTPLSRINSCFSKMSSYRIMETVTNERRNYDGNKKIHQEFSVCQVEDYSFVNLDSEYSFIGKTDEESQAKFRQMSFGVMMDGKHFGFKAFWSFR